MQTKPDSKTDAKTKHTKSLAETDHQSADAQADHCNWLSVRFACVITSPISRSLSYTHHSTTQSSSSSSTTTSDNAVTTQSSSSSSLSSTSDPGSSQSTSSSNELSPLATSESLVISLLTLHSTLYNIFTNHPHLLAKRHNDHMRIVCSLRTMCVDGAASATGAVCILRPIVHGWQRTVRQRSRASTAGWRVPNRPSAR
jgi:hypothetical protein